MVYVSVCVQKETQGAEKSNVPIKKRENYSRSSNDDIFTQILQAKEASTTTTQLACRAVRPLWDSSSSILHSLTKLQHGLKMSVRSKQVWLMDSSVII